MAIVIYIFITGYILGICTMVVRGYYLIHKQARKKEISFSNRLDQILDEEPEAPHGTHTNNYLKPHPDVWRN